ncbi:uncharacterized protein LOC110851203 [Folsomia candida]|uniref:rRNA-processing protein FYV7 n=1 Tax=Folsomia candida TaxID=158441 RepID=A0A226E5Y0_FOLCA|nr:uncharacterized protein LOC110851203 [Folsomia candida]XP_021954575.1 uncharacterized protein LOC110851203 [Folsomia candida]XP_021954577.1 uncharacterized protein LOC110851203 [Folsomia candida]XP_021954578.1 uncharacterized protein LOC110851203 [Folsomia candida]XP_021954579.1 uncharacterized protein LOC110851203 [Folsomia candida]XP_021954580.1 uncharacterized protein LOC110851203 [Folsomia candida]XP_021954581.1 uncharacterized protein LOC110851203 [Folsomia candida]XP_021954582.1 unc
MDKTTVKKSGTSSWNVSKIKSGNKHFVRKNVHGTTSRRPVATSSWNVSADFKRPSTFHHRHNDSRPNKYEKKASPSSPDVQSTGSNKQRKLTALQKARDLLKQRQEAAVLQKAEAQAKKQADLTKKLENIEKRKSNFKAYSKRNKFGQPVMASRMQMLLEKIQRNGPET